MSHYSCGLTMCFFFHNTKDPTVTSSKQALDILVETSKQLLKTFARHRPLTGDFQVTVVSNWSIDLRRPVAFEARQLKYHSTLCSLRR